MWLKTNAKIAATFMAVAFKTRLLKWTIQVSSQCSWLGFVKIGLKCSEREFFFGTCKQVFDWNLFFTYFVHNPKTSTFNSSWDLCSSIRKPSFLRWFAVPEFFILHSYYKDLNFNEFWVQYTWYLIGFFMANLRSS